MNASLLNRLGLARKAGYLELGEDAVGSAARARHARLLIVACDAGDHTVRRARNFATTADCPLIQVDSDKKELGYAVGRSTCAMAALTEPGMALSFAQALGTLPEDDLALLQQRDEKAAKLRKEAKTHKKNLKYGKK